MKTPSEMFWEQKERMRQVAKKRARGPELIAWLAATNRCTMDDLEAGLKVFKKIGDRAIYAHNIGIEFGPGDFAGAVMYEAKKEMEEKQS